MTGLSEQAKELHMMMGRRKPSEIQAVLNTRYWKNTEKTIKRTVGSNIHEFSKGYGEKYEKIFISKVAEIYMLHHTAAILKRNGIDVDVFNIPARIMSPSRVESHWVGCSVFQDVPDFSSESEISGVDFHERIKIDYSYILVPSCIRKKLSSLMRVPGFSDVHNFSGSLYSYLLERYPASEVKKLMQDLPSTEDDNFRRSETGSQYLKESLGEKAIISELFIRQFALLFSFLHDAKYVKSIIFNPVKNDILLSENLAYVLFFSLLHSDIKRELGFRAFLLLMENEYDDSKKRDIVRKYVNNVTKEYSLCIPDMANWRNKK